MYQVTRELSFCYGHRLMNYDGKCKVAHGHNGRVEITVMADTLDERGMVVDFGDLKRRVGDWIDRELDHKMLLRGDDPLVAIFRDIREPIFVMEDNPTAENIARLIYRKSRELGFRVTEVRLWETDTSCAVYRE